MSKPSPIDWKRLRQASEAAVETLRGLALSEITPSRRDFTRFLGTGRGEVAVIAALRRRDPWSGERRDDLDVLALAGELDEADVAALAVSTEPLYHGGRDEDLRLVAEAVTAPVLRDEPLVHPLQVFHSRTLGADACIVPAPWVDADRLAEIVRVAGSLHMAALLSVFSAGDVAAVLPYDQHPIGVWAQDDAGAVDLTRLASIAAAVPPRRPLVLLGDVLEPRQFHQLRGAVDAAVVARPFTRAGADEVLRSLVDE